jgi:release factor glutamine methyltransferase
VSVGAVAHAGTFGEALRTATHLLRGRLASPVAATPQLDAQVLLAHVTGVSRALLLAYPDRALDASQAARFSELIARRLVGEPVAYLVGHREFLGLDLLTDARALIPRPETELLVEAALAWARERLMRETASQRLIAADIGTGSGAIALALAAHEPRIAPVYAVDVSDAALSLARENARRLALGERVRFLEGDLLEPLVEQVDLLLANLPYVAPRAASSLPPDVRRYEPAVALYAPDEGLALLRRFLVEAPAHLRPGALVGVEFGFDQRDAVERMAREAFPAAAIRVGADYAGWDRFALIVT